MTETGPLGTTGKAIMRFTDTELDEQSQFQNVVCAGIPAAGMELKIVD